MSDLKPLIVIGGGGHASVLVDILRSQQRAILGVVSPDELTARAAFDGLSHWYQDDAILSFPSDEVKLINGIGALPHSKLRCRLNEYFLTHGYQFETVIAPAASVSPFATIEAGAQILTHAIVQAGAMIGSHSIINTGALVEHDCMIGEYNHIAPRATLCGQVQTEDHVFIGAGATVIQDVHLAEHALVGAGAVVTKHLTANTVCYSSRSTITKRHTN
ncbi:sugar O-acyltransferase (sialic acid O-acetyltransferase NeuD family) [Vibrio sp. ES.051]|uniref:acetyltransferase n=1 Tax=Vibrio sp. ES.051 TaxID=1761909 RepID=UPI000BFA0DCA|nr:acetyltransferase [Vibrio sp. ES.051]PFG45500.1 sugar O-acyltransferase (sialic acid O-acetyltransferase NeuD family) [Vibrio sp. ES.051]